MSRHRLKPQLACGRPAYKVKESVKSITESKTEIWPGYNKGER